MQGVFSDPELGGRKSTDDGIAVSTDVEFGVFETFVDVPDFNSLSKMVSTVELLVEVTAVGHVSIEGLVVVVVGLTVVRALSSIFMEMANS